MTPAISALKHPTSCIIHKEKKMEKILRIQIINFLAIALLSCLHGEIKMNDYQQDRSNEMRSIDIIPGKSIGELHLGMSKDQLPPGVSISVDTEETTAGELNGIRFLIKDDKIQDLWIEDFRKFKHQVRFKGKIIPPEVPLETLKNIFGGCQRAEVKGGVFFTCQTGVTISCDYDYEEKKGNENIQLRIKPRLPN